MTTLETTQSPRYCGVHAVVLPGLWTGGRSSGDRQGWRAPQSPGQMKAVLLARMAVTGLPTPQVVCYMWLSGGVQQKPLTNLIFVDYSCLLLFAFYWPIKGHTAC